MSELLVRVRDREGHNPRLNGEGHVVVICADGWVWSTLERSSVDWRILRVPELSEDEAEVWMAAQRVLPELYVPARRAFWVNPERWDLDLRAWWYDDGRAEPARTISKEQLDLAKDDEPLYERQDVIGMPAVIG